MADNNDEALLAELGIEVEVEKKASYTAREERIIAGFEDIQRFYTEHNRLPQHGEDKDIFERIYAIRLDQIAKQSECMALLASFDHQGLLAKLGDASDLIGSTEAIDDEALLGELGIEANAAGDITQMTHVKTRAEKKAAEEIASHDRCEDFEQFEPLFDQVQADLKNGERQTIPYGDNAEIRQGQWFILKGMKTYIAEEGEEYVAEYGRKNSRLRVIYDNGTESNLLKRSLERALQYDDAARRISEHESDAGPLFSVKEDGVEYATSGTIYVLRSLSEAPDIAEKRALLHKIGVTGSKVETRIANAKNDPTFLLADVEIVATYQLFNIQRHKLESLIHKFLQPARLDFEIKDRFGKPVKPREWFLVPLHIIDEMVTKIKDKTITDYHYDPAIASIQTN